MKSRIYIPILAALLLLVALFGIVYAQEGARTGKQFNLAPNPPEPLDSAITYQGVLKQNGQPLNGECSLAFRLYDSEAAGTQVGEAFTVTRDIQSGLINESLDFGPEAFDGISRWLEIKAKCGSDPSFTTIGRQMLHKILPLS